MALEDLCSSCSFVLVVALFSYVSLVLHSGGSFVFLRAVANNSRALLGVLEHRRSDYPR